MPKLKRYILLPREGFLSEALKELHPVGEFIGPLRPFVVKKANLAGGKEIRVIHSILPQGPKLVELDQKAASRVVKKGAVLIFPIIMYGRPFSRPLMYRQPSGALEGIRQASLPEPTRPHKPPRKRCSKVTIKVLEKKNGKRVPTGSGLLVTAFSNYSANEGDEKVTDDSGKVIMELSGNTIEQLYCEQLWRWGAFRKNIRKRPTIELELEPLKKNFKDSVRQYYGQSQFNPTTGVTVGVIDTGVGDHEDLNVERRLNVIEGQSAQAGNDQDLIGHGTFVAGLIGSQGGKKFPKLRGLAPGVKIQSYRIFGGVNASNFDLWNAIYLATNDRCDILNLSIENGDSNDQTLQRAIKNARENGTLVIVAAGNDFRGEVNYPAAFPCATAISAMGCEGTFPRGAIDEAFVGRPPDGTADPKEFIAGFSNIGKQISVTGLGVGVLSTLPENGFGSCSGTSMAAPVVSGAAACLLSQNPDIYNMPRDRARSDAIEQLLLKNCVSRGFGSNYEGSGMPNPGKV